MFEKQLQMVLACHKPLLNQGNSKHIGVTNTVLTFSFSYPTSGVTTFWEVTGYCVNSGSVLAFVKDLSCFPLRKSKLKFENLGVCQNKNCYCSLVTRRGSSDAVIRCSSRLLIIESFERVKEKLMLFQYFSMSGPCNHRSVMLYAYPTWAWKGG